MHKGLVMVVFSCRYPRRCHLR